jgi:flagellar assembly protein FliH
MEPTMLWIPPGLESFEASTAGATEEQLAQQELERLQREAEERGYQAGLARGLSEGREAGHADGFASGQLEVRKLSAQIEGILASFSQPLARLDDDVADALGHLAVRIAGALVGREYETDPDLLVALTRTAMDAVTDTTRSVELRLHPDDVGVLSPYLATLAGVQIAPDASLTRGDLRLHSENLRVDGTMATRLATCLGAVLNARLEA